jgi:hypothetical protein
MRFEFKLTGSTAILFHADDVVLSDSLKEWRNDTVNKNNSVAGDDRTPPWTWQTYLYRDAKHLAIPSDNLMAAIRWAGAKIILKKQETYKSITQSGLFIITEYCDFVGPEGKVSVLDLAKMYDLTFAEQAAAAKKLGFSLFVKRAKIGTSKHIRVRARFDEWSISGVIEIRNADIKPVILQQIFDIAGDRAGLLDWRPSSKQSPGPFGRFTTQLKAIK